MIDWLLGKDDVLRPLGELDVLGYYGAVAEKLTGFLGTREIATKVMIPDGPTLLKRGSKLEPLTAGELSANVDEGFLEKRRELRSLPEAKGSINKAQEKVWEYFYPRKLCDMFYATNREGAGKPMDRLFFDIDRGAGASLADAAKVAASLIGSMQHDDEFSRLLGRFSVFLMFTGRSFHVYALLKKQIGPDFYDSHIQYSKDAPLASFTGRWAAKIAASSKVKVAGGHEKAPGLVNIDPSQTPSGKLGRCPFSLHMKDARTVDGVAVPLSLDAASDRGVLSSLVSWTPRKVLEELAVLSKALPKIP